MGDGPGGGGGAVLFQVGDEDQKGRRSGEAVSLPGAAPRGPSCPSLTHQRALGSWRGSLSEGSGAAWCREGGGAAGDPCGPPGLPWGLGESNRRLRDFMAREFWGGGATSGAKAALDHRRGKVLHQSRWRACVRAPCPAPFVSWSSASLGSGSWKEPEEEGRLCREEEPGNRGLHPPPTPANPRQPPPVDFELERTPYTPLPPGAEHLSSISAPSLGKTHVCSLLEGARALGSRNWHKRALWVLELLL